MGITGIWQWVLVLAIVLILFARPGKISGIMGDFGKGLRNFKKGVKDDGSDDKSIDAPAKTRMKTPARKGAGKKKKKSAKKKTKR